MRRIGRGDSKILTFNVPPLFDIDKVVQTLNFRVTSKGSK